MGYGVGMSNKFVQTVDDFFGAIHTITLSFFFKVGVFFPALVNAVLIGYALHNTVTGMWGGLAGWIAGVVGAIGMEAAGIGMSWNLDSRNRSRWVLFLGLYIIGSWVLIWVGLDDGLLPKLAGSIMPLFAVALQGTLAVRKFHQEEVQTEFQVKQLELDKMREETKQAQARAREAKAQNLGQNRANKTDILAWMSFHPNATTSEVMTEFGISDQTVRNYRKELS